MKIIPEHIAGVDEVGRGPLAGPVVAAAVILDPARPLPAGIRDSKQLSPIQRARWVDIIHTHALSWQIGMADAGEIDQLNILQASLLAMQRAVMGLSVAPTAVWVDGKHCPNVPYPCRAIVRGDATVPAISAAAILAKEVRDAMLCAWDAEYPHYGFARHKGYPTEAHRKALRQYGPCPLHRKSFAPVKMAGGGPLGVYTAPQ